MPGPDHKASLEPDEFGAMVAAIRNVERALGSGIKKPSPSEFKNRQIARKSVVAARNIRRGEILDGDNLAIKRPANGLSPMAWDTILGRRAKRDFAEDEPIEL